MFTTTRSVSQTLRGNFLFMASIRRPLSSSAISNVAVLQPRSCAGTRQVNITWSSCAHHYRRVGRLSQFARPLCSFSSAFHSPRSRRQPPIMSSWKQALFFDGGKHFVSTSSSGLRPIRILWASQGGTAQIFAQQLSETLEDHYTSKDVEVPVTVQGWHEISKDPKSQLLGEITNAEEAPIHVFLCSVTGVGEPPDNGRDFYEWIMKQTASSDADWSGLEFAVFGLGNSVAHPSHYNVVGIHLDEKLESLGARRAHPLGLGDDGGESIEDDFDTWLETFMENVILPAPSAGEEAVDGAESGPVESQEAVAVDASMNESSRPALPPVSEEPEWGNCVPHAVWKPGMLPPESLATNPTTNALRAPCPGARASDCKRLISKKHPQLSLAARSRDTVCRDLFHLQDGPQAFYGSNTVRAQVLQSRALSAYGGESGLRELALRLPLNQGTSYETGDHCMVYPKNDIFVVEAFLRQLDVDPHATIESSIGDEDDEDNHPRHKQYPYPTGLTVHETLTHCIDLGAPPSPTLARLLTGKQKLDYKQEIAIPRRTILSLMIQYNNPLSLEDLLYHATKMKPRYYSISSSSLKDASLVRLTFRPIKYLTSQGHMREGICTNYMASMVAAVAEAGEGLEEQAQFMPVQINPNPTFRLPQDPRTSVLLIAGGCGVAPIRAFVEERILKLKREDTDRFGQGMVFLGFRRPEDAVYRSLLDKALEIGALTEAKISYTEGAANELQYAGNVNELVRTQAKKVWEHLEGGGYTYLCGGARTFGASIENELLEIIQEYGGFDITGASKYVRQLHQAGRLLEDLAD